MVANATDGVFTIKLVGEMPNAMSSVKTHYEFLMCDEEERKKIKYERIDTTIEC